MGIAVKSVAIATEEVGCTTAPLREEKPAAGTNANVGERQITGSPSLASWQ